MSAASDRPSFGGGPGHALSLGPSGRGAPEGEESLDSGWDMEEMPPTTRASVPGEEKELDRETEPPAESTLGFTDLPRPPEPPYGDDLGLDFGEGSPADHEPHYAAGPALRIPSPREAPVSADLRATLPPPIPSEDYVETMMGTVRDSRPESGFPHRAPLATLMEIDPLQFDRPNFDQAELPEEAPSIETDEEIHVDLDEDLLTNTAPPPAGLDDEIDMLPFDEVLASISLRASQPSVPGDVPEIASGLRLAGTNPPASPRHASSPFGRNAFSSPVGELDDTVAVPQVQAELATPPGGVDVTALARRGDDHAKLARRVEANDYAGALMIAEALVAADPSDAEARRCADHCRPVVIETYMRRLGNRTSIARVVIGREVLQGLSLDHRAGFLLSCIEGSMSLDEVLDLSGMPLLDTVRLLWELVQEGIVSIEPPA